MLKNLFPTKFLIIALLFVSNVSFGQIIFSENWSSGNFTTNGWTFPSGQSNWTVGAAYTPLGGGSPNAFFNWTPTTLLYSNELVSPIINATAFTGGSVFLSYKFHLNNFSTATVEQFAVEYKTVGSSSWFLLTNYSSAGVVGTLNWSPTNVILPAMAGQNFQIRFRPYGPNSFNINGWGLDDIEVLALNPCTGTPSAGTASALPNNPCPGIPVTLNLGGSFVVAGGLAYQWQVAFAGPSGPWSNIGTTNPLFYNPPAGSTTWYRCIVTCTATGLTATSVVSGAVIVQPFSPTSPCYCPTTNSGSTSCITNVSFGSLNNTTPGCTGTSNYNIYPTPVANFVQGNPYTFSMSTNAAAITSYWIDYNHNTVFESSEFTQVYTTGTSGAILDTIPYSALIGQTRMRVRSTQTFNANGPTDACTAMNGGETEDYIINITPSGPYDPAIASITAPIGNSCTDSFQTLSAQVFNFGLNAINTTTNPITVTFTVNGPTGINTYTSTIGGVPGSPTLPGSGATALNFTVNPVNMFSGGTYLINAVVSCPTVTNAALANDSIANPILITNYRPTAAPDYQLCQYSGIPFGQGLGVGGCSAPLFDSIVITFTVPGTCVDGTSDATACLFGTATVPPIIAGAQINSGVLKITNLATIGSSWTSEMRFNLYGPSAATPYSAAGGAVAGSTTGASSNFTYMRSPTVGALGAIMGSPGSTLNLGYWESFNDVAGGTDININGGGTTVATLTIQYQYVPPAFSWYDVPTGGSSLYSLTPFNPFLFPNAVVNNSNVPGLYTFYAACLGLTNCRVPVNLNINPTPATFQDSMFSCEYLVGANNAIFDLPSRNSIVSGGMWPTAGVDFWGDQSLLTPVATPSTDTSSTNIIYSRVFYTYGSLVCSSSDTMSLNVVSIPQFTLPIYTGFACAPESIDISSLVSIFPSTQIDTLYFEDPNYTIPYAGDPHAVGVADSIYMIVNTNSGAVCSDSAAAFIDVLPATNNIASQDPGNFSVCGPVPCGNINLSNGNTETLYTTTDCRRIATITDDLIDPVNLGSVSICEDIDCSVQFHNGQPYVNRHYEITPTNNGKAQVCLYYLDQDFADYTAAAFPTFPGMDPTVNLCITQIDNGLLGSTGSTAISIPNSSITTTYDPSTTVWTVCFPVDSFSSFYCHTCNPLNAALPVHLVSFTGKRVEGNSLLNWETSSEQNNSHFIVERSKDAKSFSAISNPIKTKASNGNSNVSLNYDYTDNSTMNGHNYYRLQQVDIDGQISYSGTVDIYFGNETLVTLYPNPVNTTLNLDINTPKATDVSIKIMDATGRTVRMVEMSLQAGSNSNMIDVQSLSNGVYMVHVTNHKGLNYSQTIRKK